MMALSSVALAGCERPPASSAAGGTLVIGAFAEPDLLLPPLTMTAQGQQVVDAIFEPLAQGVFDDDGRLRFEPMLARTWAWSADSLRIDFSLDPKARWHDGAPVTAEDVRFTWRAYVDSALGAPAAPALRAIDSVTTVDPHTTRLWFSRRSVDQFAVAATTMRILPAHLLDSVPRARWRTAGFVRQPVGSGRFRFAGWQAGTRVEVVADSSHVRGRPALDRVIWSITADPSAAVQRLFAGDIDFLESVRPDAAAEFATHPTVRLLRSPSLVYGFLQFNLEPPGRAGSASLFADPALRRALSQGVDRSALVQAVFDSLARVALGPVTRVQLGADSVIPSIAFAPDRAEGLLDSLGWRRSAGDSIRRRAGRPLRFTTLVPSSSTQRQRIAVLLQAMLRKIGVQMEIESVEFNTLNARLVKGDFEAAIMAISADPLPGGIRGVWSSSAARSAGGVNFGNYRSARFDALVDSAGRQVDAQAARRLFREAYDTIVADAPAIWLYEPWALSGVHRDIRPVGIRPDGWWGQLAAWSRVAPPRP
jgi:peptide/nickel transport system substrate-binding protein